MPAHLGGAPRSVGLVCAHPASCPPFDTLAFPFHRGRGRPRTSGFRSGGVFTRCRNISSRGKTPDATGRPSPDRPRALRGRHGGPSIQCRDLSAQHRIFRRPCSRTARNRACDLPEAACSDAGRLTHAEIIVALIAGQADIWRPSPASVLSGALHWAWSTRTCTELRRTATPESKRIGLVQTHLNHVE